MRSSSREALILEGNALFKKSGEMPSASSIFSLLRASPSNARATQSRGRRGLRLLAAGLWQTLHALAGPDVVFCEPPAWHLEGIGDLWESAWHRAFVVRFQVVEFHDRAVRGDVGDGQGQLGVPHPEGHGSGVWHDEQHARIVCEFCAEHEACGAFMLLVGGFRVDRLSTDREIGGRESMLGLCLSGNQLHRQKSQERNKK